MLYNKKVLYCRQDTLYKKSIISYNNLFCEIPWNYLVQYPGGLICFWPTLKISGSTSRRFNLFCDLPWKYLVQYPGGLICFEAYLENIWFNIHEVDLFCGLLEIIWFNIHKVNLFRGLPWKYLVQYPRGWSVLWPSPACHSPTSPGIPQIWRKEHTLREVKVLRSSFYQALLFSKRMELKQIVKTNYSMYYIA